MVSLDSYLEQLALEFENKGVTKPAVLLRSYSGIDYLKYLSNPSWKSEVEKVLGPQSYTTMCSVSKQISKPKSKNLAALQLLFSELDDFETGKQPEKYLTLNFDNHCLDESVLAVAEKISGNLIKLVEKTKNCVFSEVAKHIKDKKLVFDMYKDLDSFYYKQKKGIGADSFDSNDFEDYVESIKMSIKFIKENSGTEFEFLVDSSVESLSNRINFKGSAEDLVSYAESLVNNPVELKKQLLVYNKTMIDTLEKRIYDLGVNKIKSQRCYGDVNDFSKLDEGYLMAFFESNNIDTDSYFETLLNCDLKLRREFLECYNKDIDDIKNSVTGLSQILEGGRIINPNADHVSVLQNDADFPNIKYGEKMLEKMRVLRSKLHNNLDKLPDISDLGLNEKLKNKCELTYFVKELPKNPLDVTFGNDSGCCLFVPNSVEEIKNGVYIPAYLSDTGIRLFGVYLKKENSAQRMGLVLAFSANDGDNVILACNSLELSNNGIKGGSKSIEKIVDFVEDWLVNYASLNGFDGVAMGSHDYNTSRNFSKKSGDIVKKPLEFITRNPFFYSDIFEYNKDDKLLVTRPGSCYWVKKPK